LPSETSAADGTASLDLKGAPVVLLVADAPGRAVSTNDLVNGDEAGAEAGGGVPTGEAEHGEWQVNGAGPLRQEQQVGIHLGDGD